MYDQSNLIGTGNYKCTACLRKVLKIYNKIDKGGDIK